MLKTIRTLVGYVLCSLFFAIPALLVAIPAIFRNRWALVVLYSIDLTICAVCHGELLESISSRSYRLRHLARYRYQMVLIDILARLFGDDRDHCKRAWLWESKTISVKREL